MCIIKYKNLTRKGELSSQKRTSITYRVRIQITINDSRRQGRRSQFHTKTL